MTKPNLTDLAHRLGPRFESGADARDRDGEFVHANYDALRRHKIFSALIPAEYGGGGVGYRDMSAFIRTIASYCPSTGLALAMHQHLVCAAVYNDKAGRPGRKLLAAVVDGEKVLVSTGANDWMESNGTMEKVDGGYLVTAAKPFASGSPAGNLIVTSATYQDPRDGDRVLHFAVPLAADGVSLAGDWDTLGMRATGSQTVRLEKVFVSDGAVTLNRPRGDYHPAYNVILTVAMPLIMSAYLGLADKAAHIAIEMAGKRIGDPVTPTLVGELTNQHAVAELAVNDMVNRVEEFAFHADTNLANTILVRKTIAANAVIATAEKALETAGGAGFYRRSGLEKLLRDAHAAPFHPMQEKRQHLFTGRIAMGLDPVSGAKPALSAAA